MKAATKDPRQFGPDGLTESDRRIILDAIARYPEIERVTLFGSRAMGTYGQGSDIDLALEGRRLERATMARLASDLDESDLPYKVDLLLRSERLEAAVEVHIRRHGYPFDWRKSTLGDVIELKRGYDLPTSDRRKGRVPVVSSSGISGWHDETRVKGPGVVTGRYGTLGSVYYLTEDFWPLNTTLYVRDFKGNDPRFIAYLLQSMDFLGASDKSSVPGLNRNDLHRYEVKVPPLDEQRAIRSILAALDDKIEQNRRTSRALEKIARAIFRAWFVDFEPVHAKAVGATSFPSMPQTVFDSLPTTFTDSDLGPIPEGWETKPLYDTAQYVNGAAFRGSHFCERSEGLPVVKIVELKNGITDQTEFSNRQDLDPKYRIDTGEMLYSWSGSPDTSLDIFLWTKGPALLNQHIFRVVTASKTQRYFVYYLFKYLRQTLIEIARDKQTTGLGHVTVADMRRLRVAWPSQHAFDAFGQLIGPIFELGFSLMMECERLAGLRDYLLPKLLSGQVRVGEVEKVVAETGA